MVDNSRRSTISIRLNTQTVVFLLTAVFLITKVVRTFSGVVGTTGGIWNIIQVLFVLMGMLFALKYFPYIKHNMPVTVLLLFSVYIFLLSMVRADFSISGIFSLATQPYAGMLLVLFYIVGSRMEISNRNIILILPTFYVLAAIIIYTMARYVTSGSLRYTETVDVADVYYLLGILPLTFIYTDKKRQVIPIIVTAIALVLSGKRTGILAIIGMSIALFTLRNEEKKNIKNNIRKIIIILVLGIALYYLALYLDNFLNLRLFIRLGRMSEDGGSGRVDRWLLVLDEEKRASVLQFLLGHGWNSVYNTFHGHAHNDFIELLYDYGIISLVLYIVFYLCLLSKLRRMIKTGYRFANVFAASIICSLFIASFSFYIFTPTYITCGVLSYGLLLADFDKHLNELTEVTDVNQCL